MTLTHFSPPRAWFWRRPAVAPRAPQDLGLRAGDWVEVKPVEEMLATLDAGGALEALPFMPEMARFCGQRFQVFKTAHKSCDTIYTFTGRRMERTVHLAGLRCDGASHGGCQAGCLLFWKEAWLRRVDGPHPVEPAPTPSRFRSVVADRGLEQLERETRREDPLDPQPRYRCQATDLLRATAPLDIFDPVPYLRDVTGGNLSPWTLLLALSRAVSTALAKRFWRLWGAPDLPAAQPMPPVAPLGLQAGDLVQVRSQAEILATLDDGVGNRGLSFDAEMAPHCGRIYRVLRRVERIIDERTGKMLRLRKDCIMLEGVVCSGLHCGLMRLGCPRSVYPYWRESWLRRIGPAPAEAATAAAGSEKSDER